MEIVFCKDCKFRDHCEQRVAITTTDRVIGVTKQQNPQIEFCSYGTREKEENKE